MTTFQIPEGKIVDRIELEAGDGMATLNVIYKEALRELSELCAILRSIENGNCTTEETFRQIDILSRRARALQVVLATQGQ